MVSTVSLYKTLQPVPFCTYLGGYPTLRMPSEWNSGLDKRRRFTACRRLGGLAFGNAKSERGLTGANSIRSGATIHAGGLLRTYKDVVSARECLSGDSS